MTVPEVPPDQYRVRIRGHLDPVWSASFDGLSIAHEEDGTTALTGPLVDQSALYGLLGRLRDLGATLMSVERLPDDPPAGPGLRVRTERGQHPEP